jgi:hypothetical protein
MGKRIQEIARENGWDGEAILDPEHEFYHEATDEAEEYLQSLCDDDVCFTCEFGPFCLVERNDNETE